MLILSPALTHVDSVRRELQTRHDLFYKMKHESDAPESAHADTSAETKPKKKLKKSSSLIRKFKLKPKSSSNPSVSSAESDKAETSRQTPEGDDNKLIKTISETNLTETSWKSAENLADKSGSRSVISIANTQLTTINPKTDSGLIERTKSLENLQQIMPAFGDLLIESTSQNSGKPNKDHLYKILVIGDLGAGKTSIIKRYVHDFFSQHYRATIGVDFALKVLHWDANTVIRLQLWDIAGQERYGNMTRVYYKEAVGAFIVFDVTRSNTFESVANWKADLDSKVQLPDGSTIPCVLLGNKCDQQKEGIVNNPAKMEDYCKEKGFTAWFETSAKENVNIEQAANSLISKILQNDTIINNDAAKDKDQFTLTSKEEQQNGRKCYKC